jgi:hypothetical protein
MPKEDQPELTEAVGRARAEKKMSDLKTAIFKGVAITVLSAVILAGLGFLWGHFQDTDGIREDLDQLYGLVNDHAQEED